MKISDITIQSGKWDKILYWVNPSIFVRNHRSSKLLSLKINQLLDDPDTELLIESRYHVLLGDIRLWVSNFPYCYGFHYSLERHWIDRMTHLSPDSDEWKNIYKIFILEKWYVKTYGNSLPDRKTVFRLRQVVESARALIRNS